jgi:hypothetical protein
MSLLVSLSDYNKDDRAVQVWVVSSLLQIDLSARTTTLGKILLLFSQPFYAQGALKSTLKLQNFSPRITLFFC